ncbi:lytic transglycosylase domain-containing protein [Roseomonas sp. SSH11]|uniref:Lytic transglycosylase domain-containing protein n=1 Tax=Pararoseomonas baculiformis TaxID=2820812 RepID=A0ABS4ALG7_9PROT|nr:lytic transglycosylase domain-containing protein [Pararoseomonas baculiformis]MBP0447861.1 lytic transglycosylase domain-containing protein [Pararoseomonas baculiformis]
MFILAAILLGPSGAAAQAALTCRQAIEVAEREFSLPPHLLAAIARVESGRRDPATGRVDPYPWTINAEGRGSTYPTKAAGIAAVQDLQASGIRSIDVGCMQVNMRHHPRAFGTLDDAFDPLTNARYAASFLRDLMAEKQDWHAAAASYHSRNPEFAVPYLNRVLSAWEQERRSPSTTPIVVAATGDAPSTSSATTPPALPHGFGAIGGGFFLSNGAERAQVIPMAAAASLGTPGSGAGRSLDAYRAAPVPMVGGAPVASAVVIVAPHQGRRLF